jgi:2'-5' RNA ligase
MAHLETTLEIIDPVGRQRPFSPHITVASRHLTRPIFQQAWSDLQTRQAEFHFVSDRLTLLIHRDQRWQIQSEFKLDLGQTEPLHP